MPAQESTLTRHERWRDLRDHLQAKGVKKVPLKLLQEPELDTRPGMRLVAHYAEIKHVSLGKLTPCRWFAILLSITPLGGAVYGVVNWPLLAQQSFTVQLIVGGVVTGVGLLAFLWMARSILNGITTYKGPLRVTVAELSLSLPDRNRHVPWRDVYSVAHIPDKFRWKSQSRIRVELDDGVVATLHVPVDDCDPLVEVMRDLILCHRKKRK